MELSKCGFSGMKECSGVAEGFLAGMSGREEAGHLSTPLEWRLLLFCVLGLLFGPVRIG